MRTRRFESRAHRVRMAAVTSGPKQLPALRRRDDPGRPRRADCSGDVCGDVEKANRWLRENLAILDGRAPLEVARTESGARVVEQIWRRSTWARRHSAPLAVIEPAARSRLRLRLRAREQRPLEYNWAPSDGLLDGALAHRVGEARTCH
jgi:hypothetical protein